MPLEVPRSARVDSIVSPRADSDWWTRFEPSKPLFKDGTADWKHVSQGQIGNCYALAAFISVALRPKGPEWIDGMMIDNGDGTATGRLYSTDGRECYIKAKKAICVMKAKAKGPAKETHDHADLWVSMLEIFLTCFTCPDQSTAMYDPANASFKRINGGWGSLVLRQMTGKDVLIESIPDPKKNLQFDSSGNAFRSGSQNFEMMQEVIEMGFQGLGIPPGPEATFLNRHAAQIRQRFQAFLQGRSAKMIRKEHYLQGFVNPLLSAFPNMPPDVKEMFREGAEGMRGKRGTGVYQQSDLALFDKVKGWCEAGRAVVADTREHIASSATGTGHSAGEEVAKGLVGGHAYAVEKAYSSSSGTKYIRMVNPWGSYIRKYSAAGGHAVARDEDGSQDSHGRFNLKLADFVKRFHRVSASTRTFS
jgi:hypothetical protein